MANENFEMRDSTEIRCAIVNACLAMSRESFFVGTWGNISVRTEQGLLVTPSRLPYDVMKPEDLVHISFAGKKLSGKRLPSSETELHRQILLNCRYLNALIHVHSKSVMALAALRKDLPVCTEEMAQILGAPAKCSPYVPGGRHSELALAVIGVMKGGMACAAIMSNHGGIAGGRDLNEAMTAARVLEKSAAAYLAAAAVGKPKPIPSNMVREERNRYLHKYGVEDVTEQLTPQR